MKDNTTYNDSKKRPLIKKILQQSLNLVKLPDLFGKTPIYRQESLYAKYLNCASPEIEQHQQNKHYTLRQLVSNLFQAPRISPTRQHKFHKWVSTSCKHSTSQLPPVNEILLSQNSSQNQKPYQQNFQMPRKRQKQQFKNQLSLQSNASSNGSNSMKNNNLKIISNLVKLTEQSQDLMVIDRDKGAQEQLGPKAIKKYYLHYKKLDRIKEQNELSHTVDSPYTAILSKSVSNCVLPIKAGILKMDGDISIISANNCKFGDKYIEVMSEGVKILPNIHTIQLNSNRISEIGANCLLSKLQIDTKTLDLQDNHIGCLGSQHISRLLKANAFQLQELNLENNRLGNRNIMMILDGLQYNMSLEILNISRNLIDNTCAGQLQNLLSSGSMLKELYLHWNQINGKGGMLIFQALPENQHLLILDLSWNSLGVTNNAVNESCVPAIQDVFRLNSKLLHLDLSNNYFSYKDSKDIGESLAKNHTIYGFHFEGNYGYVNFNGFLNVDSDVKNCSEIHIKHRIAGLGPFQDHKRNLFFEQQSASQNQNQQILPLKQRLSNDCCWICEGWYQEDIFFPDSNKQNMDNNVYVHFSFDGFQPKYMGKYNEAKGGYVWQRMLPPMSTHFFFTVTDQQVCSPAHPTITVQNANNFNILGVVMPEGNVQNLTVEKRNIFNKDARNQIIDKHTHQPVVIVKPRTPDQIPANKKKGKNKWNFNTSIFRDWKKDTDEMLRKCFETDWGYTRFPRIIKNPEDLQAVKETFWSVYKQYKDYYKRVASQNPVVDVWAIQQQGFREFIDESRIVDGKLIQEADVEIKFVAAVSAPEFKGNFRNPERGLVRHQLMEAMLRIVEEKYIKSKLAKTYNEALKTALELHYLPVMVHKNEQVWRDQTYWCEEVDRVLKYYRLLLDNYYLRYSVKKKLPGRPNFMCLDELNDFCRQQNLFDDQLVEKDVPKVFNLSMMTQVDEINSDRIFQMTFVEFLEALTRIADKRALFVQRYHPEVLPDEITLDFRNKQPIHCKLEALLVHLHAMCQDFQLKDLLKVPKLSLFANDDNENEQ